VFSIGCDDIGTIRRLEKYVKQNKAHKSHVTGEDFHGDWDDDVTGILTRDSMRVIIGHHSFLYYDNLKSGF